MPRIPHSSGLLRTLFLLCVVFFSPAKVLAHAEGESYVFLNFHEDRIEGEFQFNRADLKEKLGLDIPAKLKPANRRIGKTAGKVQAYINANFQMGPSEDSPYQLEFLEQELLPEARSYVRYRFRVTDVAPPDSLAVRYDMFYEDDPTHRGLLLVQYNVKTDTDYGPEHTSLVFSPSNNEQELDLTDIPGLMSGTETIVQGMLHIWKGLDHVLFLVSLLLPTVLLREGGTWTPVPRAAPAVRRLLAIVTVFTVAHSITLLLAALELIKINDRLVESMIALSIALVALNNIFFRVRRGSLWVILGLGLFHGLGFASVMGNLPFRMVDLVETVIRFNIGVELGQIVIVLILFPILYALRHWSLYQRVILVGGSWLLVAISLFWFVERSLGLG